MRGLERWGRKTFDKVKQLIFKNVVSSTYLVLILLLGIIAVPRIFAEQQAIHSVEIFSEKLNYMNKEPGSWKVTKSAKWVSKGTAEITFDVDTIAKTESKYTDILFVLDVSGSMNGAKLNKVKADTIELIDALLSSGDNKAGLITFDTESQIVSPFTNDKEELIRKVNSLKALEATNYYHALINVDSILKDYVKMEDRACVILFLTDGFPNAYTPNEEGQYNYLKSQYPYAVINGIQYEMGDSVLEPIKKVSDNQFIADMNSLNNILFDASIPAMTYDNFEISDYIDTNYFYVDSEEDIKVSSGMVTFNREEQKFTWNINEFKSGLDAKMTVKVKLKEKFLEAEGYYPTNKKEEIKSKIKVEDENVVSPKTPVLANNYKVIYDGNAPNGCKIESVPETKIKWVLDTVGLSDTTLKCEGYRFKGWEIATDGVKKINADYFIMPEKDVTVRAEWGKINTKKSLDGEIYEQPHTLEKVDFSTEHFASSADDVYIYRYQSSLHNYQNDLTKIVIQDTSQVINNAIDVLDLSKDKNESILAYIVPNEDDSTTYTAYIQCEYRIIANKDSSHLFAGFSKLKSIEGLDYIDTSNVVNMSYMFGSASLESLDLTSFNTSKVTDMSYLFAQVDAIDGYDGSYYITSSKLKDLKVNNLDTSKVTNMSGMFAGTSMSGEQINSIFGDLDTSKVTNMEYMFYKSTGFDNFTLNNLDTSSVINMSYMFYFSNGLVTVDLSNLDISNVVDMHDMFNHCLDIATVNLNGLRSSNTINMSGMFYDCMSLTNIDFSTVETLKPNDMSSMFGWCSSLTNLDLNSFDTSSVKNMSGMFRKCSSLTNLDVSNFNTSNVTNMSSMFGWCSGLISLDLSSFDTLMVEDMSDMFNGCSSLGSLDLNSFDTSNVRIMWDMFNGCSSLTSLDLNSFDTSNVTTMESMFCDCSSLTTLNLSNFDTSNVTTMESMFCDCSSLTTLNLSNFDTSNVTNMDSMFYECGSLTSLDLSGFDTSEVTDMSDMFRGCSSLTNLDLKSFETSKVRTMWDMFNGCSSLTSLDLSGFDTSELGAVQGMFDGCSSLISLDLSGFDTSKVRNMRYMFNGCSSLTSLDVSSFDTSRVENMSDMFNGCSSLGSLDLSSFDTSNVTVMSDMFNGCSNLTSLDVSSFDTSKVEYMGSMFNGCSNLTSLDVSGFRTRNASYMSYMFKDCSKLTSLDLSGFDTSYISEIAYLFSGCSKLSTTIKIAFPLTYFYSYEGMFEGAATEEGAQIIVNYTSSASNRFDLLIGTKSENSNVVKGELVR